MIPLQEGSTIDVDFIKLHPDAIVPTYQTDGAGCFDIHAFIEDCSVMLIGGGYPRSAVFGTKLAVAVPKNWVMEVYSRSGHGFKHQVRLGNCVGIIDSDYRGEIRVSLCSDDGDVPMAIHHGDRIAQGKLVYAPRVNFKQKEALVPTERGAGGFGSTGTSIQKVREHIDGGS